MSAIRCSREPKAFTLIELLCVMAVIGILASLLLPVLNQAQARAKRVGCLNNLRQVGVAFQSFAHDHNGQFPMAVPVASGGSSEFALLSYQVAGQFYFSFRNFLALLNELVSPRLLACPADTRLPAASFISFNNEHLSYLVGLRADYSRPYSILAGDRNLTNDYGAPSSLVRLQFSRGWRWTSELHQFKGNLLFADGHTEEKSSQAMAASIEQGPFAAELALPSLPPTGARGQTPSLISSANPGVYGQAAPHVLVSGLLNPAAKPQSPPSLPAQPMTVGSTILARQIAFPSSDSNMRTVTNTKTETKAPGSTNTSPRKPSGQEEPGFSFFPPAVGTTVAGFAKSSAWVLYLLLLLFAAAALYVRIRLGSQKRPPRETGRGP